MGVLVEGSLFGPISIIFLPYTLVNAIEDDNAHFVSGILSQPSLDTVSLISIDQNDRREKKNISDNW